MFIDKRNDEHYLDPTCYEALMKIAKDRRSYMPIIYVCTPYSGDIEGNTKRARKYCKYVLQEGGEPLAPHLLFPQFTKDRELGIHMDLILHRHCKELWVFGKTVTRGMEIEIRQARKYGKTVKFIKEEFYEV